MFMSKRNRKLFAGIEEYISVVEQTLDLFLESMEHYLKNRIDSHFEMMVQKTHESESVADDLRRDIERELYEKSLLPDSREDIFTIIDKVDQLPNKAESILRQIYTQNIVLPESLEPQVRELVKLGVETYKVAKEAIKDSLAKMEKTKELIRTIDTNESIGDRLEQKIIYEIFHSDIDRASQIHFRDIVLEIGRLLDLAEILSDAITIFTIKRQV